MNATIDLWIKHVSSKEKTDITGGNTALSELFLKGEYFLKFELNNILTTDERKILKPFFHPHAVSVSEDYEDFIEPNYYSPEKLSQVLKKVQLQLDLDWKNHQKGELQLKKIEIETYEEIINNLNKIQGVIDLAKENSQELAIMYCDY